MGKTARGWRGSRRSEKHPHVRGEDAAVIEQRSDDWETPPRAWGRLCASVTGPLKAGNTPTCVGKTVLAVCRSATTRKHPHVRGEDRPHAKRTTQPMETPPRAWGRLQKPRREVEAVGNTPTCVGKTSTRLDTRPPLRKHPHVRGEDFSAAYINWSRTETPPRAWGRPRIVVVD